MKKYTCHQSAVESATTYRSSKAKRHISSEIPTAKDKSTAVSTVERKSSPVSVSTLERKSLPAAVFTSGLNEEYDKRLIYYENMLNEILNDTDKLLKTMRESPDSLSNEQLDDYLLWTSTARDSLVNGLVEFSTDNDVKDGVEIVKIATKVARHAIGRDSSFFCKIFRRLRFIKPTQHDAIQTVLIRGIRNILKFHLENLLVAHVIIEIVSKSR